MKIIECQQGGTEWALARAGVVTASEIDALVSPTLEIRKGAGVKTYLYRKAAERIMGYAESTNSTFEMQNGSLLEKVALPWYEFRHGVEVRRVGFIKSDNGKIGCSPDGLIGDDSGIEVKCSSAATHIRYTLEGRLPPDYVTQVQFSMFVTGRPMWVFCSYHPHLPPFVVNVVRNPEAMQTFTDALTPFLRDLDDAEARIRAQMNAGQHNQSR